MKSQVFLSGKNSSKGACMLKSQMKTMLISFFDNKGTFHFEFISQGQSPRPLMWKDIEKGLNFAQQLDLPP